MPSWLHLRHTRETCFEKIVFHTSARRHARPILMPAEIKSSMPELKLSRSALLQFLPLELNWSKLYRFFRFPASVNL